MNPTVTPAWSDDLSGWTLDELLRAEAENRAWNQTLRLENAELVNKRLAQQMTIEEYRVSRRIVSDNTAECRRRKTLLETRISTWK